MSEEQQPDRRPQFGNRTLSDPKNVFEHNAWDNVVWDEEQEREAKQKTDEQLAHAVSQELQDQYETEAAEFWNSFYGIHQNRFFKDKNWLFTEFPELAPEYIPEHVNIESKDDSETDDLKAESDRTEKEDSKPKNSGVTVEEEGHGDMIYSDTNNRTEENIELHQDDKSVLSYLNGDITVEDADERDTADCKNARSNLEGLKIDDEVTGEKFGNEKCDSCGAANHLLAEKMERRFPGDCARRRILEVGCGVGNVVFPILATNNDPDLMVYCCDFSPVAVQLVKENVDYERRCHAFVCDISEESSPVPFPDSSIDIITLIFVLSAIHPDKMQGVIDRLARFLKPGGTILFRDYGRYDMAQLRFKKGRCLSENFYVRGDGTRAYFFTQDELRTMMTKAGLVEKQNLVDRRLQVNRGKQLKMYRVWIQCKYTKPLQ